MSTIAKDNGGDFTPAPEGQWQAVCVDVIDLGMVEREYNGEKKTRPEVRVVYQLMARDTAGNDIRTESGARFTVSKLFGLNLSVKGTLRPYLESWRGRKFTKEEAEAGFDIEKLIGANALLQIVHNEHNGKVYGNIASVMPWNTQWGAKIEPENYVRKVDRDKQAPAEASAPKTVSAPAPVAPPMMPPQTPGPMGGGVDEIPF